MKAALHYSGGPVHPAQIKKIVAAISRLWPRYRRHEMSVAFVDNATIRHWNKKYRGRDAVTDVLSFADQDVRGRYPTQATLGEIIIAYPRLKTQAAENKHSVQEELTILLIHGFLHLIGYDHKTGKEFKRMERQAAKIRRALIYSQ